MVSHGSLVIVYASGSTLPDSLRALDLSAAAPAAAQQQLLTNPFHIPSKFTLLEDEEDGELELNNNGSGKRPSVDGGEEKLLLQFEENEVSKKKSPLEQAQLLSANQPPADGKFHAAQVSRPYPFTIVKRPAFLQCNWSIVMKMCQKNFFSNEIF